MSLLPVGFGASGGDYEITDSLRLRSSASAFLDRTNTDSPTSTTVWTCSFWVKRGTLGTTQYILNAGPFNSGDDFEGFHFKSDDTLRVQLTIGNSQISNYTTNAVFRDPSAWYHFVIVRNGQAYVVYVNGVSQTFGTSTFGSNPSSWVNAATPHEIGNRLDGLQYFDGYLTEFNCIDGQALTPTDFGEYDANGTWKAKRYTGTYGTNGFYLPMKPTTQAELQNTVLYAGNTDEQSIAGIGYAPDFVWIKNRTGANNHYLYDTIRGTDRLLISNSTSAELTGAQQLTSFDTDGFTVPYDVSGYNNYAGRSYVAWTWDAGDNQTSTGISSVQYFGQGVAQSVKGFGFSPDLVWIKSRDIAASSILIDSVRGSGFELSSNTTGAETSNGVTRFKSIDSDGFTLANTTAASLNQQNRNYVAWGWDAGDGDPVSNTTGDINSTVKANDATGFSIVTYSANGSTGTIGHGLSSAPELIIVKKRNAVERWTVYHQSTSNAYIYLNETFAAETTNANLRFGNNSSVVAPTSSVFTVGNSNDVNGSGGTYVAYCFSEVSGVSKFDSYTGTGAGSHAITTGFRPGFVMIKRTDSANSWTMIDATRNPFNIADSILWADLSDAEASGGVTTSVNFTDTGFELNGAGGAINTSGGTYIYMAFKGSYSDYVSPLNDTGTIDSRAKANPDKGFSIVSWTGDGSSSANVGTGLSSSTPLDMAIVKRRDSTSEWQVGHVGNQGSNFAFHLELNSTAASSGSGPYFMGSQSATNGDRLYLSSGALASGGEYIAYCFHSVAGYSKFDSYTGNGSTTGPTITTGFRPAFVMIKRSDSTGNWMMFDTTRNPFNPVDDNLYANLSNAENNDPGLEVSDTGFQLKAAGGQVNVSSGTYIYMAFAETADAVFNFDASGNKNNWLPNNINSNAESETTYDLMKDTPSLVDENAGNFATLNPLVPSPLLSSATLSEGNLKYTSTDPYDTVLSTIGMTTGKWYFETYLNNAGFQCIGARATPDQFDTNYLGQAGNGGIGYYRNNGAVLNNGVSTSVFSATTGDIIQVALDADNGYLWFGKNNSWYGTVGTSTGRFTLATTDVNPTFFFAQGYRDLRTSNFGQRPFAYTPPTGFLKLNTFNLPDSTIEDGSDYFNTVLYTGTSAEQAVTVGFQPDFTWIKQRNGTAASSLADAVRGAKKRLLSDQNYAEVTYAAGAGFESFDTDGFTVNVGTAVGTSGRTYVAWNWLASNTTASNTVGTIPSTVSVNTTAGFSVVGYAGNNGSNQTVGHGLGTTPSMFIIKNRTSAASWPVYHKDISTPLSNAMYLNSTNAAFGWAYWGTGGLSSTVFPVHYGSADVTNQSGQDYIAYVFAEIEGYSAFGSYTGNGSADGTFVYTGFRPAWIMVKRSTATGNWQMFDSSRDLYNPENGRLYANLVDAENDQNSVDFVSNGFKLRDTSGDNNSSGQTYIYMAFAENPFKNALAR